ncbi:MAG: hypothetical protein ACOC8A_02495 [bacterium]
MTAHEKGKATTIREAWAACDLGPLSGDKLHWYVDLSEARGEKPKSRLASYFDLCPDGEFMHAAFTGHRGCGKSTELLRLKDQWEGRWLVVYFEVTELLDPNDIAFSDLFLTTSMKVAEAFHEAGMPLDPELLDNVERFAETVIQETTRQTDKQLEAGAQASGQAGLPFVAKLKARITSQLKASTQHKQTIRRIFERDVTRLITDTNLLLDNARHTLRERDGTQQTDLLFILDNLDRLPPAAADRLIFQHGELLKQLRAHVVYTVPVSEYHSPKGIDRVFPQHDILPMVSVFRFDRDEAQLGWEEARVEAIAEALERRVDTGAVFQTDELVGELARHSGGCLRHLMQLARSAFEAAHAREADKVAKDDVDDALRRMRFDFERMIPPEHYPLLQEVARSKRVPNSDQGREALYNLSVLEYDGGRGWNYVHPLVRQIERFAEEARGQGRPQAPQE